MRFSLGRPREEASDKKGECPYCAAADRQAPSPAVSTSNEGTQAVHARPNQRQYHPLKENRDVPQWKLRPHGRDTGGDPPLLRSCGDPWMARQLCRRDPRSLARGCQGENSVKIIPIKVSAWIRSAWRELGTPARVLAGVERIRERIVEHSEASELFRSQLALRRPTSTTRMTPKRVRQFCR